MRSKFDRRTYMLLFDKPVISNVVKFEPKNEIQSFFHR